MEAVFEYRGEAVAFVHELIDEDAVINRAAGVTDEMLLTALDRAIARASGEPIPLQSRMPTTAVRLGALCQWSGRLETNPVTTKHNEGR